jgi:hypothetical protein
MLQLRYLIFFLRDNHIIEFREASNRFLVVQAQLLWGVGLEEQVAFDADGNTYVLTKRVVCDPLEHARPRLAPVLL